jgi:tRNA G18 (ribose-2'-O)-methylase SpoU
VAKQLNHDECKVLHKNFRPNIIFVLENFEHEENIGSAFRLADAFNIDSIIIVSDGQLMQKKIDKTARSCNQYVKHVVVPKIEYALEIVKAKGYTPYCVDYTTESRPIRDVDFAAHKGVALIMGNEKYGVSQSTLDMCSRSVHIEMFGNNTSMNVASALAIVAYKASEDILKSCEANKK